MDGCQYRTQVTTVKMGQKRLDDSNPTPYIYLLTTRWNRTNAESHVYEMIPGAVAGN